MAGGQITVVHALEQQLRGSGLDLSKAAFRSRLEATFPDEEIVETEDTLEVCGAVFLFKNGIYSGSQSK